MNQNELYQMCLEGRKVQQEKFKKELEELDIEYKRAEFEEDMYNDLTKRGRHRDVFSEKHSASMKKVDELATSKDGLEKQLKILEIEIEYIESKMK